MNIGIFYGSTTGNTANAAQAIQAAISSLGNVSVHSISDAGTSSMNDYDVIILGSSTWGMGEIQDDWYGKESLVGADLANKKVAVFGTGDQMGYDETFVDALGILADAAEKAGATLIGSWPTDGYAFSRSAAVKNDRFVGLPLDDDNQPDQTEARIKAWTQQLISELQ